MQITLEELEIKAAIRGYIKEQGLSLGDAVPEITLTAGRGATGMTAAIAISKDITLGLGAGKVEVLASKPKADPKDFPVEKAPAKKKATPKKAPAKKAVVKEEPVEEVKEMEDPFAEAAPAPEGENLFGDEVTPAEDLEEEEPVVDPSEVTADSLFAS